MHKDNETSITGGSPNPTSAPVSMPTPASAPTSVSTPTPVSVSTHTPTQTPTPIAANQPFQGQLSINQPFNNQPIPQASSNTSNTGDNHNKKRVGIIIGCTIGAIAIIAVIAVLLIVFLKPGEKIVSCTTNSTIMGVTINGETTVTARDGEISSADMIVNVDFKSLQDSYRDQEKEIVDRITEDYKERCKEHCVFNYDYIEGDSAKYTMQFDKDGVDEIVWSYGTENMSAQEIADKVQETFENSNSTCVQR